MVFYDPVSGKIQLDLIPASETRNERSRPTTPPPNRQYNASPGDEDELLRILRCIAKTSDLGFSTKIGLVHDRQVKKRQMEEILDAGLGEPWMILEFCHDEPWADELYKERKDVHVKDPPPKSHSGMELLGKYVYYEKKIVIFDRVCDMVSHGMKLHQKKDLVSVVLAHEASHAVTHLGRDHDGRIWSNFSHADVDDTEQFAQIYAFLCLKNARDFSLEKVFQQLSDHQSRIYNLWKVFKGTPVKEINRALMKARLKSPSSVSNPMKSYIEKKRTPLPLSKEIKETLKHLELLESSIGNPDWAWERGYRIFSSFFIFRRLSLPPSCVAQVACKIRQNPDSSSPMQKQIFNEG